MQGCSLGVLKPNLGLLGVSLDVLGASLGVSLDMPASSERTVPNHLCSWVRCASQPCVLH